VLGLFVIGSHSREGFADELSDYDVGVVVRNDAVQAFDARWPYKHGAPVEVLSSTLATLREHARPGTPSEWARYQYAHARVLVDKTGEVSAILAEKARLAEDEARELATEAIDSFVNSTWRSLRNRVRGLERAARLDAAESIPYLLTAIFALERRIRPFNKYLEWELREHPLADPRWQADALLPRIDRVGAADEGEQHAMFCDLEQAARSSGLGAVIDSWEPDVARLRGTRP
jgi:hypothetical protein